MSGWREYRRARGPRQVSILFACWISTKSIPDASTNLCQRSIDTFLTHVRRDLDGQPGSSNTLVQSREYMPSLMRYEEILGLRLKMVVRESIARVGTNSLAERRDRPFDFIFGSEYHYELERFNLIATCV
jgi:hypothetical protein